ncbi:hypothetical protein J5X84_35580 [Streptosporangiaceae bacterium NEAU-GS5]|nr:hypothetical protein [Streptosporangiaceae bacterium NEAU-GS5]
MTDGGPGTEDRVRGLTAAVLPGAVTSTHTDQVDLDTRQLRELGNGLRLGLFFVLLVAACSLTVAAVAGMTERRRPFSLLRAAGMRLGELRAVVLLETATPLVITVIGGAVLGMAASAAIAAAGGQHWAGPGFDYLITAAGELLGALTVTALSLPLINSITRHDAVRYD